MNDIAIRDVVVLEPNVFGDDRGFFFESFNQAHFESAIGKKINFVQDNHSRSRRGVLRGLHYQREHAQGKLVQVVRGAVFDVAVDIRRGSPSFGQWAGAELTDENHRQLWVPPGFAHGFCVLSEACDFTYKCTDFYHPADEGGLIWNDPDIDIDWPIASPSLSAKDAACPRLSELPETDLPVYG